MIQEMKIHKRGPSSSADLPVYFRLRPREASSWGDLRWKLDENMYKLDIAASGGTTVFGVKLRFLEVGEDR